MAYKDFDINSNYSVYQETTFELSEEYFKKKIENYNIQDTCAKGCILGNITMDDFNHFRDSLLWVKCHFCHSGFTSSNKPTLDRKNNRIGHTKDNV
jgi:MinD superfamily P-loop ATPase